MEKEEGYSRYGTIEVCWGQKWRTLNSRLRGLALSACSGEPAIIHRRGMNI
jgi:hypothetical protein